LLGQIAPGAQAASGGDNNGGDRWTHEISTGLTMRPSLYRVPSWGKRISTGCDMLHCNTCVAALIG
jgi:hypothetical protein